MRSVQSAISPGPQSGRTTPEEGSAVSSGTEVEDLLAQLAVVQSQLAAAQAQNTIDAQTIATLQAQVTSLQAQVVTLQAQIVADAITIANLQGQVASLQAQVASLQAQVAALSNPLYSRFIIASIVEVGGGIYVPPSYDDPIISLTKVNTYESAKSITVIGGGYP